MRPFCLKCFQSLQHYDNTDALLTADLVDTTLCDDQSQARKCLLGVERGVAGNVHSANAWACACETVLLRRDLVLHFTCTLLHFTASKHADKP